MATLDHADVPGKDELERFEKYLYKYHSGDEIIQEGAKDTALYLLRFGEVGIFKNLATGQKHISTIQAVNFFGEMSVIIGGIRNATVRVTSDIAIVYKFQRVDLKSIYSNASWSGLLIQRLCNDLSEKMDQLVMLEGENYQLKTWKKDTTEQSSILFSALLSLQGSAAAEAVMTSREWTYVSGMKDLTEHYLKNHLPEIYVQIVNEKSSGLSYIKDSGELPASLKKIS